MPALIPPTYEDAALVLRLYELRREEKLRAAREWFRAKFFPQSFEEVKAVALGAGIENTHYRMVTGYWDMAASFVATGILHPELFFDSGGEALFVWAKIGEFVPEMREGIPVAAPAREPREGDRDGSRGRPSASRALRSRMPGYRDRILKAERG